MTTGEERVIALPIGSALSVTDRLLGEEIQSILLARVEDLEENREVRLPDMGGGGPVEAF
ncbi:MAG: hypothetical protein LOD87_07475 [Planifilum fulgidum]